MPTSGVTTWSLTARDICTAALQENGILALGREMRSAELAACLVRLNAMLKAMLPNGYLEATATVTVPADDPSGTLDADVAEVLSVRRILTDATHRPLFRMERDRYFELPNMAQSGDPLGYYASEQVAGLTLYVWPVPTADTDLHVDYVRAVETVTDAGQTVDIPQKYQEAIYSNLAVRCAGIFGVQSPPELVDRARRLELMMFDAERPRSYFMEPDCA